LIFCLEAEPKIKLGYKALQAARTKLLEELSNAMYFRELYIWRGQDCDQSIKQESLSRHCMPEPTNYDSALGGLRTGHQN